jgi:hypothetical protein
MSWLRTRWHKRIAGGYISLHTSTGECIGERRIPKGRPVVFAPMSGCVITGLAYLDQAGNERRIEFTESGMAKQVL